MADPTPAPRTDWGAIARELQALAKRIEDLESPSGTQIYQAVPKLRAIVEDLQRQLEEWTASRYTNAQIDGKDATVAGQIQPAINTSIASTLAGSVTVGGNLVTNGQLRAPDAVSFNITGTRRTTWIEDATGRFGYAPSTRREKVDIRDADEARLLRVLDIVPRSFLYRAEIRRRYETRIAAGPEFVHPHEPRELGLIAEELDATGLWEFVIYDADGDPEGIEYSMLVVAQQAVLRHLDARSRAQDDTIAALTARLDALEGGTTS